MCGPAGYARRRRSSVSFGATRCSSYFLLPTSYFLLLLPTYWLLATATDYWLLATDYWLLATDYWLLATGYQVLFLDVLFPLKVKRVIYIDSDQLVRAVR